MNAQSTQSLASVFFGATGAFSLPPLQALLAAGLDVRAVVLSALAEPGAMRSAPPIMRRPIEAPPAMRIAIGRPLPLLTPFRDRSIASLAAEHAIPIYEVARLGDPLTLATLAELAPDVICVACCPRRLPPALLALPRLGCVNVHPSLLPDNRGPDPLFWTFQRGDRETGVTIHRMDAHFDSGPILAQERVALAEGIGEAALERELAACGGALLVDVLRQLAAGTARPAPQDETRATAYSWPDADDYVITPAWSARRAFTFAAGIRGRAHPITIQTSDARFTLVEPLGYDEAEDSGAEWRRDGDVLRLRCTPGVLRGRVAPIGATDGGGR
jgi:methionyl-tRNA formyltransferase